nr:protein TANC1 isoform X1 [Bactrocera oleae]
MFSIIDAQSTQHAGSDCVDHIDLNSSFTSDIMTQSCESDVSYHIYNELQYATQQQYGQKQIAYQQQQPITPAATTNAIPILQSGIIYGFRTRHLSCIEENDSDSLHSTSVPQTLEMLKDVDECFKQLTTAGDNPNHNDGALNSLLMQAVDDDDDGITMIDETRLYDMEYFDELSVSKNETADTTLDMSYTSQNSEEYWQSTTSEPVHLVQRSHIYQQPDIMTTSCYGALNTSFDSESSGPPVYMSTSTPTKQKLAKVSTEKVEALYATPEKRREHNRSFDSQTSSIYGAAVGGGVPNGYEQQVNGNAAGVPNESIYSFSLNSGVSVNDMLQQMSLPIELTVMNLNGGNVDDKINPAEELSEEMAAKCLNAAQNDLQSIRRLLEHDSSGTICPSCRISFDKGKRRKLIDTCGHERCYSCMFRNDQCPMCMNSNSSLKDVDCNSNAQGYDTGIGGSTSTIVSPLGSPQPQLRSQVQQQHQQKQQQLLQLQQQQQQRTNAAALARYMQHNRQESISPEYHRYASISKLPKAVAASQTTYTVTADIHHASNNNNNNNGNTISSISSGGSGSNCNTVSSTASSSNNNNGHNNISNNHYNNNNNSSGCGSMQQSPQQHQQQLHYNTGDAINASSFATPPTRRRFFNHKNLRSALTGHRRTASNGGVPTDAAATILVDGKDNNALNTSTCSDSAVTRRRRQKVSNNVSAASTRPTAAGSENRLNRLSLAGTSVYAGHLSSLVFGKIKSLWSVNSTSSDAGLNQFAGNDDHALTAAEKQKDQLRARLGLLLDSDQHGNTNTTTSSSSSQNVSPEQTLSAGCANAFGSQLSVITKDDTLSLAGKLNALSLSTDNSDVFPVKARKTGVRRSARAGQLAGGANKRNAVYKPATVQPVQLALKPLFFEVPLPEPDPPFIGRQWLLRELSNILTGTETPGVLINGNPGTGKTALILQLVEYSCFGRRKNSNSTSDPDGIYCPINLGHDRLRALASHIVGYHFCQADSNLTCLVPDFVHSLAAQLCQAPQLEAYREYLLSEPHLQDILSVKECIADAERVMRMAILEPLIVLKRAGKIPTKTCVILVDALCEAEYHRPDHGHTIATFLAKMTQHFPSWLKVVATVRTQMLEFVKGLSYTKMTLDSWASNDLLQKDMLDYITFRVNHSVEIQNNIAAVKDHNSGQLKFIGHLQTLTKGSMLYAKLILDLIERGQLVIKSTSYKVLPVSLAQIFLLHFNLRFPTNSSFEKAAPILNVCLAALYPLTLNEIYYTICAMKTDEVLSWDEFLQRFKLLDGFLIRRIDNTYMFFHSYFREWLIRRDEGESLKFLCDFRLGHAAIAFRLSRMQAPLDPEQTMELGHHMLKAHIYRNCLGPQLPRDMQSFWVATVTDNISAALGSLRNVYSPNLKVSRLILLAGASPHYHTEFMGGATILCIAAHEGIMPMVNLLLEFGADVSLTNSQGCTPLILAAIRGHADVVRLLVAAGSSLGQTDTTQRCALVHAARTGRLNVVKYLLACDWTPRPNSQDVSLAVALQQSLIAAAAQDHVTIVEDLLEIDGIDVNLMDEACGELPLTAAARNGCSDTVAILLPKGARIDARNKQDFTALWLAVKEGHWAVVEKLIQNGADIDEPVTIARKTPLMIAAEEGHIELLELLIERGAALEAQDEEGFTALSWASLRGRQPAAKCLIERGCNRNHADNKGRTPLDLAAYQGSAALVLYLLEQGANIEHIDVNGMRPLDRAIACRNIQVVQVFLRRGAKLGPTTWSMAMGKPEILIVLLNKLLEDGNVLYRKNRFHDAAHRYQYALRKISCLENLLERSAIFAQLRTNLLLNLSRCKRKLNELDESIDLATQAIAQKPASYEGYYARSKSRMESGDYPEALVDANEAMQKALQSGVSAEVVEVLKRIQAELLAHTNSDAAIAGAATARGSANAYEEYALSCADFGAMGLPTQNESSDL